MQRQSNGQNRETSLRASQWLTLSVSLSPLLSLASAATAPALAHDSGAASPWAMHTLPSSSNFISATHAGNAPGFSHSNAWQNHSAFSRVNSVIPQQNSHATFLPVRQYAANIHAGSQISAHTGAHRATLSGTFGGNIVSAGTTELGQTGQHFDLDLTSTKSNIMLGSALFHNQASVTITVGSSKQSFKAGSVVTAGEYVAIQQVLAGGTQAVKLSGHGAVTGGNFNLYAIDTPNVLELVIPKSVSALEYFSTSPSLSLFGDLTNYGSIYAISTNSSIVSGTISASDITNKSSGIISTVLPSALLSTNSGAVQNLSFNLQAANNIVNEGSITSAGSLNVTAGGSIINVPASVHASHAPVPTMLAANNINLSSGAGNLTNNGSIASSTGNINISSSNAAADLNISARGGTFSATAGDISVRDGGYNGAANINMAGGNYLSQNVNLNGGTGTINANLQNVTGTVNATACNAHIGADAADLKMGDLNVSGDPTYYNTGGNLTLANINPTSGQDLALLASGDVTVTSGIIGTVGSGKGGNLTIVAGANITVPASGANNNDSSTTVTWTNSGTATNGSKTGGNVNLTGVSNVDTSGSNSLGGGNMVIVAYAGATAGTGNITVPVDLHANGTPSAVGGDITLIAGATSGTSINTNGINQNNNPVGAVTVSTAVPVISGSGSISVLDGAIQAGSGSYTSGTIQGASINLAVGTFGNNMIVRSGNDVNLAGTAVSTTSLAVEAAHDIIINTGITSSGGILMVAGHNVTAAGGGLLSTFNGAKDAGALTVVSGASFTDNNGSVKISGVSAIGGTIDFSNLAVLSTQASITSKGGDINLIAFAKGTTSTGDIKLAPGLTVSLSGSVNGNFTAVSGRNDGGAGIVMGAVSENTSSSKGDINLLTAVPTAGLSVSTGADAGVVTGKFIGGTITLASITTSGSNQLGSSANVMATAGTQLNYGNSNFTIGTAPQSLQLRATDIFLTGSPFFQSTSLIATGNISLSNQVTSSGGIFMVAGGNISTAIGGPIALGTANGALASGAITIIAGASFTDNGSSVLIKGASTTGGTIDFSTVPLGFISTTSTGANAGNINLVAFSNGGANGSVLLANTTNINMNGGITAANGNFTVVAGQSTGSTSITMGAMNAISGGTTGGGITLITAAPVSGQTINTTGQAGLVASTFVGGTVATGSISAPATVTAFQNSNIVLQAGQDVLISNTIAGGIVSVLANGAINVNSVTGPGGIALIAGGSVTTTGAGSMLRSVSYTSGSGGAITVVAGADFSVSGSTVTINKASAAGGNIDFATNGFQSIMTQGQGLGVTSNGGNVTLAAFGSGVTGSVKLFSTFSGIVTGGTFGSSGTSSNGNVTVVAGRSDGGLGISMSPITTSGGSPSDSGNVTLLTAQPASGGILNTATGAFTGSFTGGSTTLAGITTTGTLTMAAPAVLTINAGTVLNVDGGIGSIVGGPQTSLLTAHDINLVGIVPIKTNTLSMIAPGNISLSGSINATQGIVIVAGQNVSTSSFGTNIQTQNISGTSGPITIVAGALFTDTGSTVTIKGASATGGTIDFATISLNAIGTNQIGPNNAGDVNLAAFANGGTSGAILLANVTMISTVGGISANNGNVTIVAGRSDGGTGIATGTVTTGFSTGLFGDVNLVTAQPLSGAVINEVASAGTFTGAFVSNKSIATVNASITVGSQISSLANVAINSGKDVTLSTSVTGKTVSVLALEDINFASKVTGSGGILLVAGRNITSTAPGALLSSQNSSGDSGDITVVAGASFTNSITSIVINGVSGTGGSINFSTLGDAGIFSASSFLNGSGGDINVIAYGSGTLGSISLSQSQSVTAGGAPGGIGNNGNFTAVAGLANGSASISAGAIFSSGGLGIGGDINLLTAQPAGGITINEGAGAGSFNGSFLGGTPVNASISDSAPLNTAGNVIMNAGNLITLNTLASVNAATVSLLAVKNITFSNFITAPAGIFLVSGGDIASVGSSAQLSSVNGINAGGAITMVAGANFSLTGLAVSIVGGSTSGGVVDLSSITTTALDSRSTAAGANGGDINLVAFANSIGNAGGKVLTGGTTSTGGNATGTNGRLTVVAGRNDGSIAISLGKINTSGGANGSGIIELLTAAPTATPAAPVNVPVGPGAGGVTMGVFPAGAQTTASVKVADIITTGADVNIIAGANVSAGNITATGTTNGGSVTIVASGTSVFNLGTGGTNGALTIVSSGGITGDAGKVFISNFGSSGITVQTVPTIKVNNGNGGTIYLDADNGALVMTGGVIDASGSGITKSGGFIFLSGDSISNTGASIPLNANGSGSGSGGSIVLQSRSSDLTLGTASGNFKVSASGTGGAITVNAGHNLVIANTATVTADSVTLSSANGGAVSVNGSTTGINVQLTSNGDINVGNNITATSILSLIADGNINKTASELLSSGTIVLAGLGSVGNSSTPLQVFAANLTAQAGNDVYIVGTAPGLLVLSDGHIGASNYTNMAGAGGTYSVTASLGSGIKTGLGAPIAGNNVILTATTGGITLQSLVQSTGVGGSIALISKFDISAQPLNAPTLVLASTSGNIGSNAQPILINALALTAQASGSVYLNDVTSGNVNVINATVNAVPYTNTAGGVYSLTATNTSNVSNITTTAGVSISANQILLTSTSGGLALAGPLTGTGVNTVISLNAHDDILSTSLGSTITASTVYLQSQGNVGAFFTAVTVNSPNLSANAAAGLVNVTDNQPVTLVNNGAIPNGAGSFFTVSAPGITIGSLGAPATVAVNGAIINLFATGSGSIVNGDVGSKLVTNGGTVLLTTVGKNIGDALAINGGPINTDAANLDLTTGSVSAGNIFVSDSIAGTAAITGANQALNYNLVMTDKTSGSLVLGSGGSPSVISATNVNLTTSGLGSIGSGDPSSLITIVPGGLLSLATGGGDIGSGLNSAAAIAINTARVIADTGSSSSGNVWLRDQASQVILTGSASSLSYHLTMGGANGAIQLGDTGTPVTFNSQTVSLTASGTGTILRGNSLSTISGAGTVILNTSGTDIGDPIDNGVTNFGAITTNATSITAATGDPLLGPVSGNVYLNDTRNGTVALDGTSAANTFNLTMTTAIGSGAIQIGSALGAGHVSAGTVNLTAVGPAGSILNGNTGSTVGSLSGSINLLTSGADIGDKSVAAGHFGAIATNAATIKATTNSTANGAIYLTDSLLGQVNVSGTNKANIFSLTTTAVGGLGGVINLGAVVDNITAHQIFLNASGNINMIVDVAGNPQALVITPDISGNGGTVSLTAANIIPTGGAGALQLFANGTGSGDGGLVAVSLTAPGTNAVIGGGAGDFNLQAKGFNGGSISFATTGILTLLTNGTGDIQQLDVAPTSPAGGGGIIQLSGQSVTGSGATTALKVNADGGTNGPGGFISITQTGSTLSTIGTAAGQFELSAMGGNNSSPTFNNGNGSGISFVSGGNLVVDPLGVNITPSSNQQGENVTLQSSSATTFNFGLATKNSNGVLGVISVGGTNKNGNLSIINTIGSVTNSVAITDVNALTMGAGSAGTLLIGQNLGSATTKSIVLSSFGSITSTKSITTNTTDGLVSLNSTGGSIGSIKFSAVTVDANAPTGSITLIDTNKTGNVFIGAVSGNSINTALSKVFSFTGSAGIHTTADINAGTSLVLKTSSTTDGITLGGSLDAGGAKGVVTVTGAVGINTIVPLADISAIQTVTLSATKGAITTGSIGAINVPATVSVTALNSIVNLGSVKAGTTITEKATATGVFGITTDGTVEVTAASGSGVVTLTAAGTSGIKSLMDIGAGKSVTLSAAKGTVAVNSIGAGAAGNKVPTTISITALGDISNAGLVHATTTVTEKNTSTTSSTISVNGSILASGATTGVVTLSDAGPGGIVAGSAADDISGGKSVTLTAAKGGIAIGSIGVGQLSGIVKATSLNALTESGSIKGGTAVTLTATSTSAGSMTLGSISTTGGPITAIANAGKLTVSDGSIISAVSNSKTKATVTLENNNTASGKIAIGVSDQITTGGRFGGNVNIVIGKVPGSPVFGIVPGGKATYSVDNKPVNPPTSGGPFFFGANGITINNPTDPTLVQVNSLNGAKVIFNAGSSAGNITIAGGITGSPTKITADPPSLPAILAALSPVAPSASPATAPTFSPATAPTFSPAIAPTSSQAIAPTSSPAYAALSPAALAGNFNIPNALSSDISANLSSRTLYGRASQYAEAADTAVPMRSVFVGGGEASEKYEIDAALVSGSDMAIDGPKNIELSGWTGPQSKALNLRKGNVVVAPDQDTVIDTAFGQVHVGAGSMALIMALPTGTAVYNLDDQRKDSVVITIGEKQLSLQPGRHAMVTSRLVEGFAMVNPVESFGYRNLSSSMVERELQAFTSEFSVTNAISNVKQLRALVNSRHPQAKRIAGHMIKTAAIVAQLSGGGEQYERYEHPRMTAAALIK